MNNRSWVEIDLQAIVNNLHIYQSMIPNDIEIMAVVKADAYGHGDIEVSKTLQKQGIRHFAVSNIEEAINLRSNGITGEILILGYTSSIDADKLIKNDLTQTLISEEHAKSFVGKRIKAQFAIDTGMNRIGLDGDNSNICSEIIHKYANNFVITGVFTHLCAADDEKYNDFTKNQICKFKSVIELLEDLQLPEIHCLNSSGGIWIDTFGNIVRLGVMLYGLKASFARTQLNGLKPALSWKSVISMIKDVYKGESIGYGCSYVATQNIKVATISTGYADGYNRLLSNKGYVIIHGMKAPILGKICMDQMMVDVSHIPEAKFEDEVILIGEECSADDMAQSIQTIGYEIVCNISRRVKRIYKG